MSLLAVGSGEFTEYLLHHPMPSSRRHVIIRVDMPVPVDVIRVLFWMEVFIKMADTDNGSNYRPSLPGGSVRGNFKISMAAIEISDRGRAQSSVFFIFVANCRKRATKAVDATDSVRSRR